MPYSKKLAVDYKDNLQVVFISLDEDSLRWRDFSTHNLSHEDSYFMRNTFTSGFAKHFSINAIPRYMLFDRAGKLLDEDCLPPYNTRLKKRLENLITKK
jgi:hypothetical protein